MIRRSLPLSYFMRCNDRKRNTGMLCETENDQIILHGKDIVFVHVFQFLASRRPVPRVHLLLL